MEAILLLMFFLGVLQLIWALIAVIFSRRRDVRIHLGYYLIGVLGYFGILVLLGFELEHPTGQFAFFWHFFGNAGGLALYHALIVSMPYDPQLEGIQGTEVIDTKVEVEAA